MAEDRWANIATVEVTQSAANAVTFAELRTNIGIQSDRKTAIAMLIDQIDYFPVGGAISLMTTSTDSLDMALTISDSVTDLFDVSDRRILHSTRLFRFDAGTAANANFLRFPLSQQFFPALITAERSLFLGLGSTGLAAGTTLRCRIYHRFVELSDSQFLEIAEVFRLVG